MEDGDHSPKLNKARNQSINATSVNSQDHQAINDASFVINSTINQIVDSSLITYNNPYSDISTNPTDPLYPPRKQSSILNKSALSKKESASRFKEQINNNITQVATRDIENENPLVELD